MEKKDIKSMTVDEIKSDFAPMGIPPYKAKQVFSWAQKGVDSFDKMTDISKEMREKLAQKYQICNIFIQKKLVSEIDDTVKYLYKLDDGSFIESVVMKYHHGYSVCVSTQVGCRMGCRFCATGREGFVRNLKPSEILAQILTAQRDLGVRISNVVLMGMGEPLDNFDNVVRFLELVGDENGLNIGMRHISLSTCGIVPKIYELAKLNYQITLSVSLHAPNDELRSKTMPINRAYPIEELLKSCREYIGKTGRRISFEYAMIDKVNNSPENARELASKLKGMLCHVNLIPVNPVDGSGFCASDRHSTERFVKILERSGITATVRRTLGADINASCGQLRRNEERKHNENRQ
ncbi:MAG: 23S rRNA (adenine(2503)-C(2))-methyltransferase RlmN [Acutalibacteraceae bacterium]